jgi:geranylgeranyl pyrophosphate synthase
MSASRRPSGVDTALGHFVAEVDARMEREIAAVPAAMPAASLVAAGGKRLRARILWLSASVAAPRSVAVNLEEMCRTATAIELAHLASLVHDDIVDGARTRRGVSTVHAQHGIASAARAGTALLHVAGALIASLPTGARRAVAHATVAMCRGQVRELMQSFQRCSRHRRLAIMHQKTAALFDLVAHLGATLAGGPPPCDRALRMFARRFGIAYQIADDIMDLVGDPARLGRANGADLRDGVMTLPVLLAAESSPAVGRALARLRASGAPNDTAACIRLIVRTGSLTAAAEESRRWLAHACVALDPVPASPACCALLSLAETTLTTPSAHPDTIRLDAGERRHRSIPLRFDYDGAAACGSRLLSLEFRALRGIFAPADACILRQLARIERTMPGAIHPLVADAEAATITARLWRECARKRGDWPATSMATRAFALAEHAATDARLERSPLEALTISDSLHAVALTFLAAADTAAHADVEALMLRHLRASAPGASRSILAAESGYRSAPAYELVRDVTLGAASA